MFVVERIFVCIAANCGVLRRYSIKESERHRRRNFIVKASAPDEWRRTQAPTRREWQLYFCRSDLEEILYTFCAIFRRDFSTCEWNIYSGVGGKSFVFVDLGAYTAKGQCAG